MHFSYTLFDFLVSLKRQGNLCFLVVLLFVSCKENETHNVDNEDNTSHLFNHELKMLSLNTWQEGTSVEGGFEALVNTIAEIQPDVVFLSEIRNYNDVDFSVRLQTALQGRNAVYYTFNPHKSPIILLKFPVSEVKMDDNPYLTKGIIEPTEGIVISLYAAHLDYTHYACYLPRGYDGITWQKLAAPVTDVQEILKQNEASQRDEAITLFLEDADKETKQGHLVFLAGDFNEPSHLDWTEATKDLYDHHGAVVPWTCSMLLEQGGFKDVYRVLNPNVLTHPGFTWAAYNKDVALDKLVWAPEADERDRIDFIYYYGTPRVVPKQVQIVGPAESIVKGQGYDDEGYLDDFVIPSGTWPSDHKGILATFYFPAKGTEN